MAKNEPNEFDIIEKPEHYNYGKVECIDVIKDILGEQGFIDYCHGNAVKYIFRAKHKDSFVDNIKKAVWYLNRIVEESENKQ